MTIFKAKICDRVELNNNDRKPKGKIMGYKAEPIQFTKKAMWIGLVAYCIVALIIATPFL
ncbi:MAG: hypothetical protein CMF49_04920 [Legionellales bacterium]|nr:hypothetical protein [Legionellales bacterium]